MAIKLGDKDNELESPAASPTSPGHQHEEEDEELAAKGQEFERYILRFQSKFPGKVY
jgi:hypothetical protein